MHQHGVYGRDYLEGEYDALQREAGEWIKGEASRVVGEGERDLVVDASFWCRGKREEYREMIQEVGKGR